MRLAIISPYPASGVEPGGGVEVSSVRLIEALAAQGVQVTVIATGLPGREQRGDVTVFRVRGDYRWSSARMLRPWRDSVRRVVESVDADLIHGQGLLPGGLAATDVAAAVCPRVVTAHGNRRRDAMADYAGLGAVVRAALVTGLAARAASRADVVIGAHPDWRVNVPSRPRRFVHIPNIVDTLFFRATPRPQPGRVLYCGGPATIKGWDILARAWPTVLTAVPEARLEATGWPNGASAAGSETIPRLEARGWLNQRELGAAMERAAVLVLPSRFEVAPVLLAEAWAARVPVVATSVGGLPTLARGAATLVAPNPEALGSAIADTLRGRADVAALVEEGRSRAEACRSERVVAAHLDLYAELGVR